MKIKVEHPAYVALRNALVERAEDVLRKVVELHAPQAERVSDGFVAQWACRGCDPGAYADEPADAPCATFRLIAQAYGVEVPK